jgi:hypothetical protein
MLPPEPDLLAPMETVLGRPFTAPDQVGGDFAVLDQIRGTLLANLQALPHDPPPGETLHLRHLDGLAHRIVVLNRPALLVEAPIAVVGFFGQRRADADPAMLEALDAELIDELRSHPDMLSYSSRELAGGGWANMVLLADPQGARRWRESARHAFAASQIAPSYYATIRIHNALLKQGLASLALVHVRTVYYDFGGSAWWQGVRIMA